MCTFSDLVVDVGGDQVTPATDGCGVWRTLLAAAHNLIDLIGGVVVLVLALSLYEC
jgi:hypothetical protein